MPPVELLPNGRPSHRASRSHSISSDKTSQTGYGGLLSPPLSTSPESAFIAPSAASQIVTNDHDSRADTWFDQYGIEPSGETALVAPPALRLVNRFLDQLLFSFLAISKSTSLTTLRPAVAEVLKPKLARAAIHGAEQELHEYLGGGDDEDLLAFHDGVEHPQNWDLELVWKRTRLRCMVYSSLGDMEEEDEDYYTEQEQLDDSIDSEGRDVSGVVSPAVAIFLTSILEYMGEQILIVAGQSAYNRLRAKLEKEDREGTSNHGDIADRVVVEEHDMERVAMDRTLGRLWRGWKKRIRSPTASISLPRSFSRESMFSQSPTTNGTGPADEVIVEEARGSSLDAVLAEYEYAAGIPLPISDNDIREIEIPGLAVQSDDEDAGTETDYEDDYLTKRPKSLIFFVERLSGQQALENLQYLVTNVRTRSSSLPPPPAARYKPQHEIPLQTDEIEPVDAIEAVEESKPMHGEQVGDGVKQIEAMKDIEVSPEFKESEAPTQLGDAVKVNGTQSKVEIGVEDSDESELDMPIQGAKTHDHVDASKSEKDDGKTGLVATVVAGAAALGAAAAVGIAAGAKGEAPQTEVLKDDSDVEDFTEEPQILTSSRISIGGRRSPDDINASTTSSIRSPSIHSLRVIDVASPTRSRSGSFEAGDPSNSRPNLSRSGSLRSPHLEQVVRVGSPVSRGPTSSPVLRSGSSLSMKQTRNGVEPSIMEEKEVAIEQPLSKVAPAPSDVAGAMQGVDVEASPATEETINKLAKAAPFVLSAPPNTRILNRGPTSHPIEEQSYQTRHQFTNSRGTGSDLIPAPLTPLREMAEVAPESLDGVANLTTFHSQAPSEPSAYEQHSSNPYTQKEHRLARVQVTPNTKNSPPRSSPPREDARRPVEAFSKPLRPTHSGSTSSGNSHKLKPLRTSEDSLQPTAEDKSQSFEQLIRSDQTIQYTLTPQNMRNIESPDSPRQVMTPTIVSNGFDPRVPPRSQSRPSSHNKHLPAQPSSPVEQPRSPKLTKSPKPIQRANSNSGTKSRQIAQPRDARIDRESVHDLAEVIRSTGPANGYGAGSPKPLHSHRGTNGTARNASGTIPRTTAVAGLPRRAESSAGRSRLQARDAVVPRGDSISDLIDFVRSGPQLEKDTHRIPRTVAPFRSTMDSDQMVGAVGGKAIDASLPETRYSQTTSINSSINSQSALLNGKSKAVSQQHSQDFDEDSMRPKRKTRRVRDPYAIDLSDDEEEADFVSSQKPKAAKEESLAEFLRNVPPPAESTVQPIFDIAPVKIKKKTSTHSFRSRFSRKDPVAAPPSKAHPVNSSDAPRRPSHTPIAAQFETMRTTNEATRNGTYAAQVDGARRVVQRSYEPRDAVYAPTRTNELAEFLMKSDPPPTQTQPQTFTPTLQKEEGAFQRMFGRKKVN